ncbi:MAG: IS200/IS605 family transposase [Bacteroidota bacterium]|nr:IS200/IS605 family transposase [Bacteroidota bacterium]
MSTYTQILYQIVFSTKERKKVIDYKNQVELYKYIYGIIKNKKSHLYRIGGVEDHIHIITHLHPSISLAEFVKDIKVSSSLWIKEKNIFPKFKSWQIGYAGFTYSINSKDKLIKYVKNQREHHKKKTFVEELKELLEEHNIDYDEKYLL